MKYAADQFPKTCRCCGLVHTERDWTEDLRAHEKLVDRHTEGSKVLALELRDCTCRSTLAVVVELQLITVSIADAVQALERAGT